MTFVSATDSLGNTLTPAGGVLTDTIGSLADSGSVTLTIVVTPGAANVPSITDTASVGAQQADLVAANNTATVKTTVTPAADMAVAVAGPSGAVAAGSTVTYTVTVTNNGPSPATGVTLTDTLPAGVTFVSATDSLGNTLIPAGSTLTDTLGGMAAGSSVTLSILVTTTGDTAATITDSARVAADQSDTNPANNTASATTTVTPVADLAVALTPPADPVLLNQPATYVFTVVNNGPSSATGVTLTVPLPSGILLTFNSATDSQGHKLTPSGGDIVDAIGDLDPGLPQTLTLVVTPTGAGTLTEGSTSDLVRVKANETDPNTTNNTLSPTSNTVTAVADLSVALAADQTQLVRGRR